MVKNRNQQPLAAFSLVEVVMALGIVSFALVALIGLFSVGITASKQASEDTGFATMMEQVVGRLRNGSTAIANGQTYYYYFNQFGIETVTNAPGSPRTSPLTASAQPEGTLYECALAANNPNSTEAGTEVAGVLRLKATFTWPSKVAKRSTNLIYATLPPR